MPETTLLVQMGRELSFAASEPKFEPLKTVMVETKHDESRTSPRKSFMPDSVTEEYWILYIWQNKGADDEGVRYHLDLHVSSGFYMCATNVLLK